MLKYPEIMKKIFSFLAGIFLLSVIQAQGDDWLTTFESSGGMRTATYEEVIDYCVRLADASPQVSYQVMGKSAGGYDIPLLIINRTGLSKAADAKGSGNVILLVQAGIHPGEAEGTDAVLMMMRDIAITGEKKKLLENVTFLFIPVFNTDGLKRFGPYHRINQNGPEEMGWRANARNLNLNRDFLKADTPEMEAWLRCMEKALELQDYPQEFRNFLLQRFSIPAERCRNRP